MLANGDDGTSRDQVLKVLGFQEGDTQLALLNNFSKEMSERLRTVDSRTICTLDNAIWTLDGFSVLPEYDSFLKSVYDSEAFSFSGPVQGKEDVNSWVFKKTNGMIENFLESPLNTQICVINATYFKGEWVSKFDENSTCKQKFINADNTESNVYMMAQHNIYDYTETEEYQMTNLPYGNGSFEMTLVLPKPETDINQLIEKFDSRELNRALKNMNKNDFLLKMPRCKVGAKFDIIVTLNQMGLPNPLSLNKILVQGKAAFSSILHAVNIEIGEEGTTAAASTAAMGFGGSMSTPEGFICNRPFFFMIREVSTGTILYMGKVMHLENQ